MHRAARRSWVCLGFIAVLSGTDNQGWLWLNGGIDPPGERPSGPPATPATAYRHVRRDLRPAVAGKQWRSHALRTSGLSSPGTLSGLCNMHVSGASIIYSFVLQFPNDVFHDGRPLETAGWGQNASGRSASRAPVRLFGPPRRPRAGRFAAAGGTRPDRGAPRPGLLDPGAARAGPRHPHPLADRAAKRAHGRRRRIDLRPGGTAGAAGRRPGPWLDR